MNDLQERKYVYTPNTGDWTVSFREEPTDPGSAQSPIDFGRRVCASAFQFANKQTQEVQKELSANDPDSLLVHLIAQKPVHLLSCFASLSAAAAIYTIRHYPMIPDYVLASIEQGILIESPDHFAGCAADDLASLLRNMQSLTMALERQYNFGMQYEIATEFLNVASEAYQLFDHESRDQIDVLSEAAESSAPALIRYWRDATAP